MGSPNNHLCVSRECLCARLGRDGVKARKQNSCRGEEAFLIGGKGDRMIQKNGVREEIRSYVPTESYKVPGEVTFDICPAYTAIQMSFSQAIACKPTGMALPEVQSRPSALIMLPSRSAQEERAEGIWGSLGTSSFIMCSVGKG